MDQSTQFEKLVEKLQLTADRTKVLVALEEFISSFFDPKAKDKTTHIFDALSPEVAALLKDLFLKEPITPQNQVGVKRKIDTLEKRLRACKQVEITLAFQPDSDAIALFSDWVKQNLGADMLINLQYDKSIVGGALVVADGAYKDYSVRKKLAGRFQIQRDEIMSLLSKD